MAGINRFMCICDCGPKGEKTSVKSENADGMPKFLRHEKFAEGCRQALRLKAQASLGVSPVRSTFAHKKRLRL